jgi:hypothetical protein
MTGEELGGGHLASAFHLQFVNPYHIASSLRFLCLLLFHSKRLTEDNEGNEAGILAQKNSVLPRHRVV